MSKIFTDGAVRCMNGGCPRYLCVWTREETKHDEWLKRGLCPSCHRKVRHGRHWRSDTKYIETSMGDVKRRDDLDSQPLEIVQVRKR